MKRSTLILLKTLTWVACLWPIGLLVYEAITNTLGPDPTAKLALTTGYNTLLLLILSLAITPVRRLSSRLNWLIKFRRLLGLYAFFYASLHLGTYLFLFSGYDLPTVYDGLKAGHAGVVVDEWKQVWPTILDDLKKKSSSAVKDMAKATIDDWKEWRRV